MENPMNVLPEKVIQLGNLVQRLHAQVTTLQEEKKELLEKIEMMASAMHAHSIDVKSLQEEKEHTKSAIEDLIKSIDTIIACEHAS